MILQKLDSQFNLPIIFSLHPRTKKKLDNKFILEKIKNLKLIKPVSFSDYIQLQKKSLCVMSDSGTLTEEASLLGLNAINLRDIHERPEGDETAATILCGLDYEKVLLAIDIFLNNKAHNSKLISNYDVNDFSDKILKLVISYTSYVNKYVWQK